MIAVIAAQSTSCADTSTEEVIEEWFHPGPEFLNHMYTHGHTHTHMHRNVLYIYS